MFKFKRLKIVEQMAAVVLISVLIPFIVTGIIINNVNQHGIRNELKYSALMISEVVAQNIKAHLGSDSNFLKDIISALSYINGEENQRKYINSIIKNSKDFKELYITSNAKYKSQSDIFFDTDEKELVIKEKINNNSFLVAKIDIDTFKRNIFDTIKDDTRQIYVIDSNSKQIITSLNFSQKEFKNAIFTLPEQLKVNDSYIYGKIKNEPIAYFKLENPDFLVITNTTVNKVNKTIYNDRLTIILTIIIAALSVMTVIGLYTYYLYINLRQLFKGIMAISKGNYKRKIRLLTNIFTPYEFVFLAFEFNKMIYEINVSYKKLKEKNKELKMVNDFRSNVVDTVSHEFRTPLTSIMGYTSRLLRTDINIDEETKLKSLKTIKRQTERLSRLVEDLLVIPEIERNNIKMDIERVNLSEIIEASILLVKDFKNHNFITKFDCENIFVKANKDRLEQILINLFENASKYAFDDTDINVSCYILDHFGVVKIENKAEYIEKKQLVSLFEKFTRIDDKTTRTTRGTGLGLFIVKGLVEAMGGNIIIESLKNNIFTVYIKLALDNE